MMMAGVAALVGIALVYSGIEWKRQGARQAACMGQLKQISIGISQYSRDYDECMPLPVNWTQVLLPYTKSAAVFQCPQRGDLPQGIALHLNAAGAHAAQLRQPDITLFLFDSASSALNAADVGTSLPLRNRHPRGFAIAFADAHVKMLARPDFKAGYGENFVPAVRWRYEVARRERAARQKRLQLKESVARKKRAVP